MEFICALFFLMIMVAASALLPILFGVAIIYIVWRVLKKKEWV
jgi:predicted PurR-regulated permease PerM